MAGYTTSTDFPVTGDAFQSAPNGGGLEELFLSVINPATSSIDYFTSFSETRQPEEVIEMLNEYLGEMSAIVFYWKVTLDKFVGDEIMAFWGAPVEQPEHAELAVRCALHMSDRLN